MAKVILKGFGEYIKRVQDAAASLPAIADAEASATALDIERAAKEKAPVNDGNLRASINPYKEKDGVWGVAVSANYAAYIEFGTKSKVDIPAGLEQYAAQFKGPTGANAKEAQHMIYEWCRKKGIPEERWHWIFVSIMTKGIKAHPFLFPAVRQEEPKFIERLKDALNNL